MAVLALACRQERAKPASVVVRNPDYLVVRSIRREADAEHTDRVELPYSGAGYAFASSSPLLDLRSFDLGAAGFAGGRTSVVGEATIWLPLTPEASRRIESWSAGHTGDFLGIFLEGRLVAAPRIQSGIGGGIPLRVSSKSEGDRVLQELRAGGAPPSMPLQNHVDPYGQLWSVEARGTWMGNRGILHDPARRVVASWRSRRWITCVLAFKGRKREVFAPRRYSELFFLDEATSLAAGHRPCAECRRSRYEEFRTAWSAGRKKAAAGLPSADEMDRVLHPERVSRDGGKKTYRADLSSLPSGTLVEHDGRPHLVFRGEMLPWSFTGYGPAAKLSRTTRVEVLTPRTIVRAIRAGFVPQVHESAGA